MGIYSEMLSELVRVIGEKNLMPSVKVITAYPGQKLERPLSSVCAAIGIKKLVLYDPSIGGGAASSQVSSAQKTEITLFVKILSPAELSAQSCLDTFTELCRILFCTSELEIIPLKASCGEITYDSTCGALMLEAAIDAEAVVSLNAETAKEVAE